VVNDVFPDEKNSILQWISSSTQSAEISQLPFNFYAGDLDLSNLGYHLK